MLADGYMVTVVTVKAVKTKLGFEQFQIVVAAVTISHLISSLHGTVPSGMLDARIQVTAL